LASIEISGLSKSYGGQRVVSDFELTVQDGEFVTLLGPSGCGKTTTLRCAAGLERPDAGQIVIGDDVVFAADSKVFVEPNKRHIGMVFQSYALWPHLSVFSNVAYPLRVRRTARSTIRPRVEDALKLVDLDGYAQRRVSMLSGGQQQRVALARAIVARPELLLFDEPLSNLDVRLRATMRQELQTLHREVPTTSLYVTHDQIEALTLSDRVVVMYAGTIQQIGRPREIYSQPANRFVAGFVGFENFIDGTITEITNGLARVEVAGLTRTIACKDAGLTAGEPVVLACRPNTISLKHESADDNENALPAQIKNITYLGEQIEVDLAVGPHPVKVRVPFDAATIESLGVGERIAATIPPSALFALHPVKPQPIPKQEIES
jgi:ABC-type Fe3+/spermidine/putrescine transport system ATPase subunit